MKYFIISDIHGSYKYLKEAINCYKKEKFDKLLILGDVLYHGPRNNLPKGYSPKACIGLLNRYKNNIIAVKGNCDSLIDDTVLEFDLTKEYHILNQDSFQIFLTHGHSININNLPNIKVNDILLSGHTHIYGCEFINDILFLNPGSVSIPKGHKECTFAILEDNYFSIYSTKGKLLSVYDLNMKV